MRFFIFAHGTKNVIYIPKPSLSSTFQSMISSPIVRVCLLLSILLYHHKVLSQSPTLKVLFVGNSLTYTNDLPQIVQELAKHDGVQLQYTTFLYPNYSLEDHWKEGKVQRAIESQTFDFVVAQQGPSALPESQVLLTDYATRLAEICKKNNVKMALYMVWPSLARSFDLENVIQSYTQAAQKINLLLCPAGLAWKYAWQLEPQLSLYGQDNFHPSLKGSLLASLTIYGTLTYKANFDFLPTDTATWIREINTHDFDTLKKAAMKALENK